MLRKLPLLVAASVISTTVAQAQSEPLYRTVFSSDSINVRYPTVSPDERWLVFTVLLANEETKLMIQPLAGGPPRDLFAVKGKHDSYRPETGSCSCLTCQAAARLTTRRIWLARRSIPGLEN